MIRAAKSIAGAVALALVACESKTDRYLRLQAEAAVADARTIHAMYAADSLQALLTALPVSGSNALRDSLTTKRSNAISESIILGGRAEKLHVEMRLMMAGR
jgi:hypothetical protein